MMKTGLPNRWTTYLNIGSRIAGTCFVPLKVPLREDFFRASPPHLMFTPSMVIDAVTNLKTVIDLTNTSRYYHPREFTDRHVAHRKIFCLGHEIPSGKVVQHFFSIVDNHVNHNSTQGTDSVIGVHCTHGINRTGYLICLYMIKRLGFTPNDALKAFSEARGHPVERTNYIDDLCRLGVSELAATAGSSVGRGHEQRPRQWSRRPSIRRRQFTEPPPFTSTMLPQQPTPWRQIAQPTPPPPPLLIRSRPRVLEPTPYQIPERHREQPDRAPPDHPHQWRHRLPGQHPQAPRRVFRRRHQQ